MLLYYRTTRIPADFAVAMTPRQSCFSESKLPASCSFTFAMWYTCFNETVPLTSCPGRCPPHAGGFLHEVRHGGDFISHSKDLSLYAVITTGIGVSGMKSAVFALKALQNSMMFRPCCPSAGPTGGAVSAAPAEIMSLIFARTGET